MAKKEELAQLLAPTDIIQPKVPFGVDPKTVLCAFFKAGRCQKGITNLSIYLSLSSSLESERTVLDLDSHNNSF